MNHLLLTSDELDMNLLDREGDVVYVFRSGLPRVSNSMLENRGAKESLAYPSRGVLGAFGVTTSGSKSSRSIRSMAMEMFWEPK